MRLRVIATALVTLMFSSSAFAGIGIFSAADGSNCNLSQPGVYVPATIHVLYLGQGGPAATGAEYKIAGMTGIYGVDYIANPTNATGSTANLGNAFDGTGHNVAWPAVQAFDGNGNLKLCTYSLVALNPGGVAAPGTLLRVVGRTPPTNALHPVPLITDADLALVDQAGGEMRINGGVNCTVAVEDKTWTGVRNLYR